MDQLDKILTENRKKFKFDKKKNILFATGFSGYNHGAIIDKLISSSLLFRGYSVEFFLCDKFLSTCMLTKIKQIDPQKLSEVKEQPRCENCFKMGLEYLKNLPIKKNYFSEFVSQNEINNIEQIVNSTNLEHLKDFKYNEINTGEEALAGALRYFGKEKIDEEKFKLQILKKFLYSALKTQISFQNLVNANNYDVVVYSHGIYVPHGIINQILKKKNIRSVVYIPSYRKNTFIFSHNDTYHKTMISEPNEKWVTLNLDSKKRSLIKGYLESRKTGENDWIWFNKDNNFDFNKICNEFSINKNKKIVTLLTNVVWDAKLHYKSNAFESMFDWISETINFYSSKKDTELIIRVHPAEITGDVPSRQKVQDELKNIFKILPENVKIIPPSSSASTYTMLEKSNLVLIYNTKTGIEAAAMGKKVVVAGEAWIRNKGFSWDAESKENYLSILNSIDMNENLDHEKKERALKYAYHIFFRRMIEISSIKINYLKNNKFTTEINNISDLLPNSNYQLDLLIDGIINKKDFINENEKIILNKKNNKISITFQRILLSTINLVKRLRFKFI